MVIKEAQEIRPMRFWGLAKISVLAFLAGFLMFGCSYNKVRDKSYDYETGQIVTTSTGTHMVFAPPGASALAKQRTTLKATDKGLDFKIDSTSEIEGGDVMKDMFESLFKFMLERATQAIPPVIEP